jgi:hypothetical protein
MGMIDLIKRTAIAAVESRNPVNVLIGTVSSENPLEIQVHQKLKLTNDFLIITERVTRLEVDLEHDHSFSGGTTGKALTGKLTNTPIRTGLKNGDKVALLRVQGGHQFLIIDKVV